MKKLFLLAAALLSGGIAVCAQDSAATEVETDSDSYGKLSVIPVMEAVTGFENGEPCSNWGSSALYTNFEGSAGEHFSWTLTNMWLSNSDPQNLFWGYSQLGYSNSTNWLMLCNVDLTFGGFNLNLGKNYIQSGGFEADEWDWNIREPFYSGYWCDVPTYQWGIKASYTTKSQMSEFILQMTTSPWGERPFKSNLWTYSGMWKGNYGWFSNIWSVSALQYAKNQFDFIVALGQRATFDDWSITIDYSNNAGITEENDENPVVHGQKGHSILGTVTYAYQDRFDVSLKGKYCSYERFKDLCGWYCGTIINWYPLNDSQDLRIHAVAGYDFLYNGPVINLGATYNIPIRLWGRMPEE